MDNICSILSDTKYESVYSGPSIEDRLRELGIDIRDSNGEIKTMRQVLKEISDKYFNN